MSSLDNFGLSATGLALPRQADFTTALQLQWRSAFGQQVNLDPRSNNGQLINIMAERFALLAELLEAIYNASYPAGAEGVAVDNLLALQGLTRLKASATRTAQAPVTQSSGITLYGLVCLGTAGTVIPAGSLISDGATPPNTFALDAATTIGAAQNAVQALVINPQATSGAFSLRFTAPSGATYTTPSIAFDAAARSVRLKWSAAQFADEGNFELSLGALGVIDASYLASQGYLQGSDLAAAINTKFGISTTSGSGSADANGDGITLDFGSAYTPAITASGTYPPVVTQSIQAAVNNLADSTGKILPFTDVVVTKSANIVTFSFGAGVGAKGQPSTAAQPISVIQVATNTLLNGNTQANLSVANTVAGQSAQGTGSATCTTTGPIAVSAGQLTNIVTPVSGWDSVRNDLDCVTGSSTETDAEALARRASLVAGQAQGPLASVLQRVRQVDGVTAAIALTNDSLASQQVVTVRPGASSGTFQLVVAGQTTAALSYNVTAPQMQAALRALTGYATATVTGSAATGLAVLWGNSVGGQGVPLMSVVNNTTGVVVAVFFGRFPKSVEVVVEGGTNQAVAQAIFTSSPAGLATYGAPVLQTTGTVQANSPVIQVLDTTGLLVGMSAEGLGIPPGSTVVSVAGNAVTVSASALSAYSNTPVTFGYAIGVSDSAGNLQIVRFSRPTQVQLFAAVSLVTDRYNTPGDTSSGLNPASQFSVGSIPTIQANVVAAVQDVSIGGTISLTGTDGAANAFRNVVGVRDASVALDTVNPPVNTSRITLQASQVPSLDVGNVFVSFT